MMTKFQNLWMGVLAFLMFMTTPCAQAQSLKDLLNKENIEKAVGVVTGKNTASMVGNWTYTGSAVQFEGNNVLQNAGGALAASALTDKLDELLEKVGLRSGEFGFTFEADSSFVTQVGGRELKGTYTYDAEAKKANLKFAKLVGLNTTISCTSSELQLLFNADKMLDLLTYLSSKSNNSTLQSIGSLADNYEGVLLGFALKKEGN